MVARNDGGTMQREEDGHYDAGVVYKGQFFSTEPFKGVGYPHVDNLDLPTGGVGALAEVLWKVLCDEGTTAYGKPREPKNYELVRTPQGAYLIVGFAQPDMGECNGGYVVAVVEQRDSKARVTPIGAEVTDKLFEPDKKQRYVHLPVFRDDVSKRVYHA